MCFIKEKFVFIEEIIGKLRKCVFFIKEKFVFIEEIIGKLRKCVFFIKEKFVFIEEIIGKLGKWQLLYGFLSLFWNPLIFFHICVTMCKYYYICIYSFLLLFFILWSPLFIYIIWLNIIKILYILCFTMLISNSKMFYVITFFFIHSFLLRKLKYWHETWYY